VSVDHARHQHPAAAVDHGHIVGLNDGQRLVRYRFDAIALDQDMPVFQQRCGLAVEDVNVADERQPRGRFLRGLGEAGNANGERQLSDGQNVASHAENWLFHGCTHLPFLLDVLFRRGQDRDVRRRLDVDGQQIRTTPSYWASGMLAASSKLTTASILFSIW
jgi:hypothetical protein